MMIKVNIIMLLLLLLLHHHHHLLLLLLILLFLLPIYVTCQRLEAARAPSGRGQRESVLFIGT